MKTAQRPGVGQRSALNLSVEALSNQRFDEGLFLKQGHLFVGNGRGCLKERLKGNGRVGLFRKFLRLTFDLVDPTSFVELSCEGEENPIPVPVVHHTLLEL